MKETPKERRLATPETILALLLLLLLAGLSVASPEFRRPSNYLGMTRFFIEVGLIALPMTLVIITGGMAWKLPADLLALPRLGAINIHPALLPRHRGPSPFEAAFRAGDTETGLTIHRMAADFDTGPILA